MNAITLHVESDDYAAKAHREKVAVRVMEYFEQNLTIPTELRALCYLADEDDNCLKNWMVTRPEASTGRAVAKVFPTGRRKCVESLLQLTHFRE
jgi:hypothetical protein